MGGTGMYKLVLIFACAACNPPTADVTPPWLPNGYATLAQCQIAGGIWKTPAANQQHTVRAFLCQKQK